MTRPEDALPFLPRDPEGAPVFAEPWQARAFALTLTLHENGAFTWSDWAACLAHECETGAPYYQCWLRALETLLARTGLASPEAIAAMTANWHRAAHATPHGTPIRLTNR